MGGNLAPALEPLEDATAARHRVFRALVELVGCLGVRLLVLEDAHWADEATLEFLLYLSSPGTAQVSLVLTCRPEAVPEESLLLRRLSQLAAGSTGLRLELEPLDVAQTATLVSSMLAGERVSEPFAVFLHERTDGLPLAVEESVRLMGDRADVRFRRGAWARRHLDAIVLPHTVRDAVLERATRLSLGALAILRAAAVLGEPAAENVLTTVAGLTGNAARDGLCEALECGLLTENFPRGQGLVFRHALAARAVYEAVPAPLRREMHLRAGQAMEGVPSCPVARLARHFREAGSLGPWRRYGELAADQALVTGDHLAAATLLHDMIVGADPPAATLVRLSGKIPLAALTRYASLDDLVQSLRLVLGSSVLSSVERAEVGAELGRLVLHAGDYEGGAAELERAVPGLGHNPAEAARAMILLGLPRGRSWSAELHRTWLDRGHSVAQDPSVSAYHRLLLAVNRATALLEMGEDVGWVAAAELPSEASDPRQALQVARGLVNIGGAAIQWGRLGQARTRLEATLAMTQRYEYPRLHELAAVQLVHLDWFTGAWDGLPERIAAFADHEELLIRLEGQQVKGLHAVATGDQRTAEEFLQMAVDDEARRGDPFLFVEAAAALARLRLAAGQPDQALAITDDPMRIVTVKGIWLWATDVAPVRVRALIESGKTGEASKLVRAFAQGLRDCGAPAPAAGLILSRALLSEGIGEHRRAAAAFARACAAWQALPRPYDALLAKEGQAQALLAAGECDQALALLSETQRDLDHLGASADADRLAAILREQGVMVRNGWRGGRRGYGDELSPRELEVVSLVVAGRTSREIGEVLCRSPKTVDTQLKSAMRKLGATTRIALAVRAAELGITSQKMPETSTVNSNLSGIS